MKINETISIAQIPKKIWGFWQPVSTDTQWRGGISKAEWSSPSPHGVGSTGEHYGEGMGTMTWKVTKWEDGRFFEFIHTKGVIKGSVASYHVEPENGGSLVSLNTQMTGPLIMRIMIPFMKKKMKQSVVNDLQTLKVLMEKQEK